MIWVTWAQHRREALFSGLVLASAATLLLVTGLNMLDDYQRNGVAKCVAAGARAVGLFLEGNACDATAQAFPQRWYRVTTAAPLALMSLPALLGVFITAPLLSREFEHGTHLLAWSQSITRLRWAVIRLGLIAAAVLVGAAGIAGLVIWWHAPLDLLSGKGQWDAFDIEGVVPVAYATFAVALGTLAGLTLRRSIAAMALTLFAFVGLRLVVAQFRPHFISPLTESVRSIPAGSWLVTPSYFADAQGHHLSLEQVNGVMNAVTLPDKASGAAMAGRNWWDVLSQQGIRMLADYHPPDRFWTFQLIEAVIFFGLAAALIAISLWWLQRRA